ncbi:MAG: hypoxanthine phosphoribosyltransferase [Deltaproteobacteria bacterium]|nr:hypoxanthine phosphoribosyltransferase [Deltaproteobacteria bacterium]MBW1876168.1 hypoxanthine phosphoribosyltransferase [Deltaproteobacteria bacterium]MBW2211066.1 hypoxanthine phosphoribosyltransferase [Deltaproteobacteria bacterium]MBW2214542.1 hypoxanthine phosphoribosyltransferase [Deltaproteobacteria bacterium]MBW2380119.1 hypoxanthine phosphoribosyltransferase [Deltaproteobacteria bacterium]
MPMKPLIDAGTIAARVAELGRTITNDFLGKDLVIVPVLKGSYVFAADLVRHIELDVEIDFLGVRSYGDQEESSGVVQITTDLSSSIEGKHVILVEDIVDTGLTVSYLYENLVTRQPASLKLASLLHKPARTRVPVEIDYLGFTVEDVFIVGYGLDYAQKFRNLPYLAVLTDEGA